MNYLGFTVLVSALFILACSREDAVKVEGKNVQASFERALLIDGTLVQPLVLAEWKGEEWMLVESFDYLVRAYSYFLVNLASREKVLVAGLSKAESPLQFSDFDLGEKEISWFGFVDGVVVKYSYDELGVVKSEPLLDFDAKNTVQDLYFDKDKLYVVLSRLGISSLAVIDVNKGKVDTIELGDHKFSKVWDISIRDGSLLVLGSLAFVDDPFSTLRYFESDLNSGELLQYHVPSHGKEVISSARILNGGDEIGIIYRSLGAKKPRVYERKSDENFFVLTYVDETSGIQDAVLFSACGAVAQVSVVTSNGVGSRPFLTVGKVKYDLYPEIENQIFYKKLFVLEEGEKAKIGVEFEEIIDYEARPGIAVYKVDDSLCSKVKR